MADGATILHADADSFYASVEQRDDPSLRGRPVIVGAGVVLAASYEAKAFGVRTPMPGSQARRLCPDAVVVPPRMQAYSDASKAMFEVFGDTTPFVEGLSIDEAFLDVGGLARISGTPLQIATKLRADVRERVGIAVTVGDRADEVPRQGREPGGEARRSAARPAGPRARLPPSAPGRAALGRGSRLRREAPRPRISTVAEVAALGERPLVEILGAASGRHIHALAHNRDPRRVQPGRRRRSIGTQRALGRRPRSFEELDTDLVALADRLARRLRGGHRVCRTVTLRLRFGDFTRATRSHTLAEATAETEVVLETARGLLGAASPLIRQRGITLLGLSFGNLHADGAIQLALPFEGRANAVLDAALDGVKERFGAKAIGRAVLLGRREGLSVPLLPENEP